MDQENRELSIMSWHKQLEKWCRTHLRSCPLMLVCGMVTRRCPAIIKVMWLWRAYDTSSATLSKFLLPMSSRNLCSVGIPWGWPWYFTFEVFIAFWKPSVEIMNILNFNLDYKPHNQAFIDLCTFLCIEILALHFLVLNKNSPWWRCVLYQSL